MIAGTKKLDVVLYLDLVLKKGVKYFLLKIGSDFSGITVSKKIKTG